MLIFSTLILPLKCCRTRLRGGTFGDHTHLTREAGPPLTIISKMLPCCYMCFWGRLIGLGLNFYRYPSMETDPV